MALYSIENDTCLGISHSGAVNVESEGFVELSDEEVAKVVDLIRKEGTSDIEELRLEEVYPDIYEKLREAYYEMAYNAEELHWLWEGYNNGYFEYDTDELMAYCAENCGFNFEYNEEDYIEDGKLDEDTLEYDKMDAFNEWLDDYVNGLDDKDVKDFFYNHMNAGLDLDDIAYEVAIPENIIKMAEKKRLVEYGFKIY